MFPPRDRVVRPLLQCEKNKQLQRYAIPLELLMENEGKMIKMKLSFVS